MTVIYKLITALVSIFVGLLIFEIFLNYYGKYNKLSKQELILSDSIYEKPKSSILKNEHPDLKTIVLNKYDADGIRNHDTLNTRDKKNIVGIFGDSHVENINIKDNLQFTTLLNDYFKKDNFVNYGVGGYSIDQVFIRYLSYKNHDIKHVYYVFSSNDAGSITSNNLIIFDKNSYTVIKPKFRFFERLLGRLNFTYFLIDIYYNVRARMYAKHTTVNISNYPKKLAEKIYYNSLSKNHSKHDRSKNLINFNKILKVFKDEVIKNNSSFQIIVLPKKEEDAYFQTMVTEKENYKIINLYQLNKEVIDNLEEEIIFKNDSHFNEYGNLLTYQLIKGYLLGINNYNEFTFQIDIKNKIKNIYN